ncbi:MAG: hypothetical protein QOF49_1760 [Chloroflexota bacterium]|jgi:imidazolonepropionase-like amidohydrolase|nr:hypothetical protein [Chloroflexota bacterium]
MRSDPRPHIERRGRAIARLRSATTAVAVAGIAGTAAFGALAAATWSGTGTTPAAGGDSATPGADGGNGSITERGPATGTQPFGAGGGTSGQRPVATPGQRPAVTPAPRVNRSGGSGHASTGGSH